MSTHFFANPRRQPLTITGGDGCYAFDDFGRRYLDLVTGLGVNALGHNHPRITKVLAEQQSIHTCGLYAHPYTQPLAAELCRMSGLDRALFTNSGTEATEAALKLVRCYGKPRTRVIALQGGFHGRSRGGLSVTGQAALQDPFAPFSLPVTFVPPNDEAALRDAFGADVAAMIFEPILGEGGVVPLTESYLQLARELATRHDALLVADECQTGLGRTGRYFAFQWAGIQPDVVTVAKPLAGGLPLGAVMFSNAVADRFPPSGHGSTFAGGPLACRVALEFLKEMNALLPHIASVGEALRSTLTEFGPVRGRGLMLGIPMDCPADPIVAAARDAGLLINCTQSTVLRFLPPYILTAEQVTEAGEILRNLDRHLR
jgi:acetylornithine aminotransferase/acetylornithine/N-succinyldiaminopimelate aminotransferase